MVAFLEGLERIRVLEVIGPEAVSCGRASELQPDLEGERDAELTALERNVQELFREVVARSPQLSDDLQTEAMNIDSPARLADFVASTLAVAQHDGAAGTARNLQRSQAPGNAGQRAFQGKGSARAAQQDSRAGAGASEPEPA